MTLERENPKGASPRTPRRLLTTAAGISFLVFTLVALLEGLLRFGLGLGNPVLIEKDAACEYILRPDQDVVRFFCHTRTNHFGMRSDEVGTVHHTGDLRLLFVGDSLTYGTSRVDQRDIFTERLHRELPLIVNRPVEVLNASAGAWAPDNELSYVRSRGVFQSDVVLWVINDGDLTQHRSTISEVGDDLPQDRPSFAIEEVFDRYIKPKLLRTRTKGDAGTIFSSSADHQIQMNLSDLTEGLNFVSAHGARLAIVYLPFRIDVPAKSASAQSILRNWAETHRVPFFDLTDAELPYSQKEIDLDNGVHFNAKGHSIIATAIERQWNNILGN